MQLPLLRGNPTTISLHKITFLLGPNGCGKTAALLALTRMFGFERVMRRIQKGDFHVPADFDFADETCFPLKLWIEADFEFPELKDSKGKHPTIPSNFAHMRLEDKDGVPIVRFQLDAALDFDGEVEEKLTYVLEADAQNLPKKQADVSKYDSFTSGSRHPGKSSTTRKANGVNTDLPTMPASLVFGRSRSSMKILAVDGARSSGFTDS